MNTANFEEVIELCCGDEGVCRIFTFRISLDNDALKKACLDLKSRDAIGIKASNRGNTWHSYTNVFDDLPEVRRVTSRAVLFAEEYDAELCDASPRALERDRIESWFNLGRDGNDVHAHEGFRWSGVYYVQGDSGKLLFHPRDRSYTLTTDEVARLTSATQNPSVRKQFGIDPTPGLLVLFPSWLPHSVEPSRDVRISIAFNVGIFLDKKSSWIDHYIC